MPLSWHTVQTQWWYTLSTVSMLWTPGRPWISQSWQALQGAAMAHGSIYCWLHWTWYAIRTPLTCRVSRQVDVHGPDVLQQ